MTVYVDDVAIPYRRMKMCHLWADTLPELYGMVDIIGVQRKWLQTSWTHFDICITKKKLAITSGAILTDKYGPLEHCYKLDLVSGNLALIEYALGQLMRIGKRRNEIH